MKGKKNGFPIARIVILALLMMIMAVFLPTLGGRKLMAFSGWRQLLGIAHGAYQAPDFELPDLNGKMVALRQFRDERPVLLYFWATWCPACRASKPALIKLRTQTKEDELAILAINVGSGDSLEKLKLYKKAHPMPIKILYDNNSKVSQIYQVRGIPLFVLIDKDGNIVYRDHVLPRDYRKYLNEKG